MEEKKIERELMSQEEFENYLSKGLRTLVALSRFRSINRAYRRGHIAPDGTVYPKRPFNNKANTSSRKGIHSRHTNELKKRIYGELKQYRKRES